MKFLTSVVLAGLLLGSAGVEAQDKKKELKVPLAKTGVKKGTIRPGYDIKSEIPASGWQAKIGTDTVLFLDMNGDEKLDPEVDAMVLTGVSSFAVPIPDKLLLKGAQYTYAFDGTKALTLTPEDLGAAQAYVADGSYLTDIRTRIGLRPMTLDAKGCLDCEKHCDYLKANGLNIPGAIPVSPHEEGPDKPGYTPEGAAAGMGANIFRGRPDLKGALIGWWTTPYHGSHVINPFQKKVGVATKNNVSMLYFMEQGGTVTDPYFHPPDGATGIPTALGNGEGGESPNPVPGTTNGRGCGMPVTVRLMNLFGEVTADLTDAGGKSVAGTVSSPLKPANPAQPDNSGCAFFIPSKPLNPNTTYKATFKFIAANKTVTWSFTTGAK
ncbi:MAG: hypothetical protein HY293_03800 [Planctomycetes bacterium]|nr:hypothetical protein [Planctomycetota bacterium]